MRLLTTVLLAAIATPAAADPVDDWAKSIMADKSVPGIAVAITCKGEPLAYRTYGLANVEHDVPVTLDTRFQTGSIGKQFTAALIQLLARDGKLTLDDPVSRWIDDTPSSWSAITIRHLLAHTSGLGDYGEDFDNSRNYTEAELVAIIKASPLSFETGAKWDYSNYGYVLLGVIARAAGGDYWGDQAKARIFEPVGMTTAQVIDDAGIVPHRAAGYVPKEGGDIQNQWYASPALNSTADGALYVTVLDMVAWEKALTNATLLTKDELADAWTPHGDAVRDNATYGYGWFMGTRERRDFIFHGGSWQGFNTNITRNPATGLTTVFLANLNGLDVDPLGIDLQKAARETWAAQGAAACAD